MAEQTARYEVIDSDGHVVEPDTLWREYAEPEFREHLDLPAGRVGAGDRDHARVSRHADRRCRDARQGDDAHWADAADGPSRGRRRRGRRWARPGGYDPNARLVDMDDEGIDVAVLYPTAMLTWVEEADVFGAACRAYNNWLRDYCSAGARPPVRRRRWCRCKTSTRRSTEMRRCVSELSCKAVMIRPAAYIGEREAQPSRLRPVLGRGRRARVPDRRAPVAARRHAELLPAARPRRRRDQPERRPRAAPGAHERDRPADGRRLLHARRHLRTAPGAAGRVPRGHRRVDRADAASASTTSSRSSAAATRRTLPSELFARQCMVSFDPDEVTLAFTAEHLGADKILWASDYPHPDAKIPGVVKELRTR